MKPITFSCHAVLPLSAPAIANQILDLDRWPEFTGYGILPGIAAAEFEVRTPEVLGTRIRVTNTDGSQHVEEIVAWTPEQNLTLVMKEFSPPLSRWAAEFREDWRFTPTENGTRVERSMELMPKSIFARPLLWAISFLLQGAVAKHLRQLQPPAQ